MNVEKGEITTAEINANGGNAIFMKVNTANYTEVEAATKQVVELCGKIEILINNAGITRDFNTQKNDPEIWQQVIDVNLTGVSIVANV